MCFRLPTSISIPSFFGACRNLIRLWFNPHLAGISTKKFQQALTRGEEKDIIINVMIRRFDVCCASCCSNAMAAVNKHRSRSSLPKCFLQFCHSPLRLSRHPPSTPSSPPPELRVNSPSFLTSSFVIISLSFSPEELSGRVAPRFRVILLQPRVAEASR
ncbi:hypothetical protein CPB85DRAFT_806515 [Mucidula mucida]|nr:hypothetical protein CPB85DRAFT_806515 [Mucidula mucida]